jgi:nucleoside-diphosphate-sugar epimerase
MNKKVLITGASGFIGTPCVKALLAKGYEVHATSTALIDSTVDNLHWHQVDLLNHGEIGVLIEKVKPTQLIHLAWYVAPGKWYDAHENYLWLQSSLELLKQFELHGGKRILMIGSGTEYDWNYGYCVNGKTPLAPNTYYGKCKSTLGDALINFSENKNIQATWARIFFLYGPGESSTRLVATAVTSILNGQEAKFTHGEQVRDFLHVDDAADAITFLLESEHSGKINVASGQPITLKKLISQVADQLNAHHLLNFGAIPPTKTDLPFVVAEVDELKAMGWKQKFTVEQGIAQTIEWWKNNLLNMGRK